MTPALKGVSEAEMAGGGKRPMRQWLPNRVSTMRHHDCYRQPSESHP